RMLVIAGPADQRPGRSFTLERKNAQVEPCLWRAVADDQKLAIGRKRPRMLRTRALDQPLGGAGAVARLPVDVRDAAVARIAERNPASIWTPDRTEVGARIECELREDPFREVPHHDAGLRIAVRERDACAVRRQARREIHVRRRAGRLRSSLPIE